MVGGDPVAVALAGVAGYGGWYLDALLGDPRGAGVRVVGVADPAVGRVGRVEELRGRGVGVYESAEALLGERDVELLCVAAPIHAHGPLTCMGLRHGARVLCEKPVAGTVGEAMGMLAAERAAGGDAFVAVGFQWSFSSAVRALKRDILGGELGRAVRLSCLVFFPRSRAYFVRNDWAGRERTAAGAAVFDSPVNNATAHYLHNMLYLLGGEMGAAATPASVEAELYRANAVETFDTAALRCRFNDGVEALFYTTHAVAPRTGPVCRFVFEEAVVTYDAVGGEWPGEFVARFRDGRVRNYGSPNADPFEKLWQSVELVRGGGRPGCGVGTAVPHARVVEALHRGGRVVDFPREGVRVGDLDGVAMTEVAGLGDALWAGFRGGMLPREMGCFAWAPSGVVIPVHARSARREAVEGAVVG